MGAHNLELYFSFKPRLLAVFWHSNFVEDRSIQIFLTVIMDTLIHQHFILILSFLLNTIVGKYTKLLLYQTGTSPCVHGIQTNENVIFNATFTEISVPTFPGMKDSFCINHCIRHDTCNVIFLAYNYDMSAILQFDWCAIYLVDTKNLTRLPVNSAFNAPVLNSIISHGGIPSTSKLVTIGRSQALIIFVNFVVCWRNLHESAHLHEFE